MRSKRVYILIVILFYLNIGFAGYKVDAEKIINPGTITETLLSSDVQDKLDNGGSGGSGSAAILKLTDGTTVEIKDTVEIKTGYNITPKKSGTKEIKLDLNDTIILNQHEYSGVSFDFNNGTDGQAITSSSFVTDEIHYDKWFIGYRFDYNTNQASCSAFYKSDGYNNTIGLSDNGNYTGTIIQPSPISGDEFEISFHFYTDRYDPSVNIYLNGSTSYSDGHQIGYIEISSSGGSYPDKFMLHINGSNYGTNTPISINEWHTIKLVCNTNTHKMTLYCDGKIVEGNEDISFQNNEDNIRTINIRMDNSSALCIIDDFTYGAPSSYPSSTNTGIYCQTNYTNDQKKIAVLNASNEVESDYTYKVLKVKSNISEISNYVCLESGEIFLNVTSQEVKFKQAPKFEEGLIANNTVKVRADIVLNYQENLGFTDDFESGVVGDSLTDSEYLSSDGIYDTWQYKYHSPKYTDEAALSSNLAISGDSTYYEAILKRESAITKEVIFSFDAKVEAGHTYLCNIVFDNHNFNNNGSINGTGIETYIYTDTGNGRVEIGNSYIDSAVDITDGQFHKYTYIINHSSHIFKLYVDNVYCGQVSIVSTYNQTKAFKIKFDSYHTIIDNVSFSESIEQKSSIKCVTNDGEKKLLNVISDNDMTTDFKFKPRSLVLPQLSSNSPEYGEVIYDDILKIYKDGVWEPIQGAAPADYFKYFNVNGDVITNDTENDTLEIKSNNYINVIKTNTKEITISFSDSYLYNTSVFRLTAETSINIGDVVGISSNGLVVKAKARQDTGEVYDAIGFAISNASTNEVVNIKTSGNIIINNWNLPGNPGDPLYLGTNEAGIVSNIAPTDNGDVSKMVGIKVNNNELIIQFGEAYLQ